MDYLYYINEYGADLNELQKPIAKRLFNNLLKRGWSYEKIYWGILLLKGRPIDQYVGLFYYDEYINEIDEKVEEAQEYLNKSYEDKIDQLSTVVGFGMQNVSEKYKERLLILDNKIWDSEIKYSKEELEEEVNFLYEKCFLLPMFDAMSIYR